MEVMLGGIRELVPRSRSALSLLVPAIAVAVGIGFFVPEPIPARTLAAHHRILPAGSVASPNAPLLDPHYLSSLPHHLKGTAGRPFDNARPPAKAATGTGGAAVPGIAVAAYEHAAKVIGHTDKGCHLSWADLAAIGRVESNNGLTWGSAARVSKNGTLTPPILGPVLDGKDGFPAYRSPDHGRLEHGGKWERAVGPMQFLPSTWAEYAQDGNHDGVADPQNYWDAALTAGAYLCSNGGNLSTKKGFDAAVLAYNHSHSYLRLVRSWAEFYFRAGAKRLSAATPNLLAYGISPLTKAQQARLAKRLADRAVSKATASTERQSSYALELSLVARKSGQTMLNGSGLVALSAHDTSLALKLKGLGVVHFLNGGPKGSYVSLPPRIDKRLGEKPSSWLRYSPALQSALPQKVRSELSLADVAGTSVEGFNTFKALSEPAKAKSHHSKLKAKKQGGGPYQGEIELVASGSSRAAPAQGAVLSTLSMLSGSKRLMVTAWTDPKGLLERTSFVLPRLEGVTSSPLTLSLSFSSFGVEVPVKIPAVAAFPPPRRPGPTTTTTTTSPSTTTTTTTSPPTTTTTSTTTTTTTTTLPGV